MAKINLMYKRKLVTLTNVTICFLLVKLGGTLGRHPTQLMILYTFTGNLSCQAYAEAR